MYLVQTIFQFHKYNACAERQFQPPVKDDPSLTIHQCSQSAIIQFKPIHKMPRLSKLKLASHLAHHPEDKHGDSFPHSSPGQMGSCSGKVAPDFLEMMCQISTLCPYVVVPEHRMRVIAVEQKVEEIAACSLVVGRAGWGVAGHRFGQHMHLDIAVEEVAMSALVPYLVSVGMVHELVAGIGVEEVAGIGSVPLVLFAGVGMQLMRA